MRRFERSNKMNKWTSLIILPTLISMVQLIAPSSALGSNLYSPSMDDSDLDLITDKYQSEKSPQTNFSSNKTFFTQKPEDYPETTVEEFFKSENFSKIYTLFFDEVIPDISLRSDADYVPESATLCKTTKRVRAWRSENKLNEIVDIIQGKERAQYFPSEICSYEKDVKHSCDEFSNHECAQGYTFRQMLVIHKTTRKLQYSWVRIPSFCMCMKNIGNF